MVRGLAIASVRGERILAVVVGFVGYGVGCAAALGVISDLVAKRQGKAEGFPHFRS
jgi:succinate-acetate transporter protein